MIKYFATPAPIFNTPDVKEIYKRCPLGLYRALELVGLPGFPFEEVDCQNEFIEIRSSGYPENSRLFVPHNLLQEGEAKSFEPLPVEVIQKQLEALVGIPYVWGGNWHLGFSNLDYHFAGLDCSGLLYQVTKGATPRNTSLLLHYGIEVSEEDLKPLDLIVYKGHVVIVLDERRAIESNHTWGGVTITHLAERLSLLRKENKSFSCRRWIHVAD